MIVIKDKNGVVLDTKGKYCEENIEVALNAANLKPANIKAGVKILGVEGTLTGEGGGITPTGTINITANGTYNVTNFAAAAVAVSGSIPEGYIIPEGTKEITSNGLHDAAAFANVNVNVPNIIPEGYIVPSGEKAITTNGKHDITSFASVDVNVPIPDGYIVPSGNFAITENGDYNIRDKETVSVNVAGSGGGDSLWADYIADKGTDWSYMFANFGGDSVSPYLAGVDSSNVTNTSYMFYYAEEMTSVPLFDTSKVTNASYMFRNCGSLTSIPDFNTSNVTNMDSMFFYCDHLITAPTIDTSKTTNMSNMFRYCRALESVPAYDTSKVTKFNYMFSSCQNLISVPFMDLSSATEVSSLFEGCQKLKTIEVTSWEKVTSVYSAGGIAQSCYNLRNFIIRNATKAPILYTSTPPFKQCYGFIGEFNSKYNVYGAKWGRIYVPDELVDTFKSATNWSKYADLFYPLSEYVPGDEDINTEPYLTELNVGNGGSSGSNMLDKITGPYGEYYKENQYNYNQTIWTKFYFHVPETATKRKLKITYRIDCNYEFSHTVKATLLDKDESYASTLQNNSQYYSSGITAMTHEIIYDNLPNGNHFITVGSYCNYPVYVKLEFVE